MLIRTSKSKIYCKIQVGNNIQTNSDLNGTLNAKEMLYGNNQIFHTSPYYDMLMSGRKFTACPGSTQPHDMPRSECRFTTCPGWNAVLRHALVWV